MFRTAKLSAFLLFVACAAFTPAAFSAEVVRTVVIDAGHGGKDPGCVWGAYREKDIVLDVAKRLGALINEQYPGLKVIYTRESDVFVELDERGRIANKAGADLFMSVHVNATRGTAPSGTETFIMGTTKGAANLEVAMRENDVIKFEEDPLTKYQGYQPGSAESLIMFNLMQYSHREQSMALASSVQEQYSSNIGLPSRGVKEAGFLVLWYPAMPAILTELGFINNAQDIKIMASQAGCEKYARCLFNAFSAYKTRLEGAGNCIVLDTGNGAPADKPVTVAAAEPAAKPAAEGKPARKPVEKPASTVDRPADKPAEKPVEKPAAPAAPAAPAVPSTPATPSTPAVTAPAPAAQRGSGVTFAVQVRISTKKLSVNDPVFGVWKGKVFEKRIEPYYKYFVYECFTYRDANARLAEARRVTKDCFLVAFLDGQPITVAEAIKLTSN